MDYHQFYKEHYFFELDRKHKLTDALVIPIGVLSVLGGALVVMVKELDVPLNSFELIQLCLIALGAVSICITTCFLTRSYYGYSYSYIATSKELKEYYEGLVAYHESLEDSKQNAALLTEEYINSEYAKHTRVNTDNNDKKSGYLHYANGFLIASLVIVILAGLFYVVNSLISTPEVMKIEIVKIPLSPKGAQEMSEDKKPKVPKQESPPPKRVEKPTPPPGRVLKESDTGKKRK